MESLYAPELVLFDKVGQAGYLYVFEVYLITNKMWWFRTLLN